MNQMLKIAICDDEQPIRDYLKKLTQACTDADVYVFPDGETLLSDQTDYDVGAFHYLLKPIDEQQFPMVRRLALSRFPV